MHRSVKFLPDFCNVLKTLTLKLKRSKLIYAVFVNTDKIIKKYEYVRILSETTLTK